MSDIDEIKKMVMNSGNSFHCRVVKYLKEQDWTVLISPYYNDNITDKPREIDLIAEKMFRVPSDYGNKKDPVIVKLFIECKYTPQKIAYWFHDRDSFQAEELVSRSMQISKTNTFTKKHHYLSGDNKVAKLFVSEKNNNENDIIYKALNQSLNSMIYFRKGNAAIPLKEMEGKPIVVNYPIIICNSFNSFYRLEVDADSEPVQIQDNFQLEVNYAYIDTTKINRNEYFLVDVVDFNKIDIFLNSLKADVEAMGGVNR